MSGNNKGKNIWEQRGAPRMGQVEQGPRDGFITPGASFAQVARGSPGRHESAAPLPGSMKARNAEESDKRVCGDVLQRSGVDVR